MNPNIKTPFNGTFTIIALLGFLMGVLDENNIYISIAIISTIIQIFIIIMQLKYNKSVNDLLDNIKVIIQAKSKGNDLILPINPDTNKLIYASFWRRLGAFIVDIIILSPILYWTITYNNEGRLNYFKSMIPSNCIYFFYYIYCVQKWGGTPGKLLLKTKIIKVNGQKISWKEAFLREIVNISLIVPSALAMYLLLNSTTDDFYLSMTFSERGKWIMVNLPTWNKYFENFHMVWVSSEFIVLLFNKRKRALHDFIAGTIVIKQEFEEASLS